MAKDLPYLASYKNVASLFERISRAKIPDAFTNRYLADTLGLKSTGDRQLISMLKKLGFLDNTGKPTPSYSLLKNAATASGAIGKGIRKAYAPLYDANEDANALPSDQLRGLIAQVSGAEEGMVKLISGTLQALIKTASFESVPPEADEENGMEEEDVYPEKESDASVNTDRFAVRKKQFAPEFRFNIEIHLPSSGSEETYLAIFSALRKALG